MIYSFAGKCPLPCSNGHHHEKSINVFSGFITLQLPSVVLSQNVATWWYLLSLAYKKTLPLVGWSQKNLNGNYSDFLTPTNAVTQKINTNIWPLRNITNPTCWDSVKMCYRRWKRLRSSRDGVHWGTVKPRTLAGKRVHQNGSIDTNFDPP